MKFFRRKKDKIDSDYIQKNAQEINEADVETVLTKADLIKEKLNSSEKLKSLYHEGSILIDLIRDYWKKEYTKIPWLSITSITFTLLYILNPLDLSPDFIPIIGFIDDATVLSIALKMVNSDLNEYKKWVEEKKTN